jgi:flagellar export protein FliJ
MNAHRFRLQSILDLRASALEDAKNVLGQALVSLASAQTACDQARREADTLADRICSAPATQTAALSQSVRQSYLDQTRLAQTLQDRILECQDTVQKCRVQVVRASRDHDILVRLREKCLKIGQYLDARKEENILNDLMNSQRFQMLRHSQQEFLQN